MIPAAASIHLPTKDPRKQAAVLQTTLEYPTEEYETESFDAEQEYIVDPDFPIPDVTDASTLTGLNQVTVSPDKQTGHTAPTNVPPEPVRLVPDQTLLHAYPHHPKRERIDVDEVVDFDSGGEAETAKKKKNSYNFALLLSFFSFWFLALNSKHVKI